MNINNISEGQVFKNYKELCSVLGLEVKSSVTSKAAQFKELSRYCKYSKMGHKITIDELYSEPLEKVENRGKSEGSRNNNTIYGDMVQLLILDLLAQCKNGNLTISRGKLLLTMNMINVNYSSLGEQAKKLSQYTEIDESIIYDFYNTSNSNFKGAVEIALKNLMDKRIIWYDIVTKVSELGSNKTRLATTIEKEIIRDSEKTVLDELGYKKVSEVRTTKHWRLFKKKVKQLLHKESTINYYYFAYDINANEHYLQEERKEERKELLKYLLEGVKRNQIKVELNSKVCDRLIENAIKRHEKGFTSRKMAKYRLNESYINNISELIGLLIDTKTKDIVDHVINTEDTDELFTDEQNDIFEKLFA